MLYDLCCGFHIHSLIYVFGRSFSCEILNFQSLMKYLRSKRDQFYFRKDQFSTRHSPFSNKNQFSDIQKEHFWTFNSWFSTENIQFCQFTGIFSRKLEIWRGKTVFICGKSPLFNFGFKSLTYRFTAFLLHIRRKPETRYHRFVRLSHA